MRVLNAAFPTGSHSRGIVRLIFRFVHPSDWPMLLWLWVQSWVLWICSGLSKWAVFVVTIIRVVLSYIPFLARLQN